MDIADQAKTSADQRQLESRLTELESQMRDVLARNHKVDGNKAWETSRARLFAVTVVTYVTMILVFTVLESSRPFLDALVPTTGFFLSTLSLPLVRRAWQNSKGRNNE